jgi:hypothetical protein
VAIIVSLKAYLVFVLLFSGQSVRSTSAQTSLALSHYLRTRLPDTFIYKLFISNGVHELTPFASVILAESPIWFTTTLPAGFG